jgi:transcriptional regulator with XRE-family HTH domain
LTQKKGVISVNRQWIKELREAQKMSQYTVAQNANITQAYFCLIESGEKHPSVRVAKAIANVLGFDWQRFYEDNDNARQTG